MWLIEGDQGPCSAEKEWRGRGNHGGGAQCRLGVDEFGATFLLCYSLLRSARISCGPRVPRTVLIEGDTDPVVHLDPLNSTLCGGAAVGGSCLSTGIFREVVLMFSWEQPVWKEDADMLIHVSSVPVMSAVCPRSFQTQREQDLLAVNSVLPFSLVPLRAFQWGLRTELITQIKGRGAHTYLCKLYAAQEPCKEMKTPQKGQVVNTFMPG